MPIPQIGYIYSETDSIATLKTDLETYQQFLRGEVYEWVIQSKDGTVLDSCGGYYSECEAETEGAHHGV